MPTATLTERLGRCYTGAVHDTLRAMGHGRCVFPPALRPLDPTQTLVGEVWTLSGRLDETRSAHETLLAWTGVLSRAPAGKVIVCQPNTSAVALMGELSAETLKRRGVRGYIVDGGCRDTNFILAMGFPVFCRFFTPADIVARWVPDGFGEPIRIGELTIRAGDYVIGDRDGIVHIPSALAEEAVARTEAVMHTENQVRTAILAGMDPQEAYKRYGKF